MGGVGLAILLPEGGPGGLGLLPAVGGLLASEGVPWGQHTGQCWQGVATGREGVGGKAWVLARD